MTADDSAILARLDRLGELLFARDPAIVDELWCDLGFRLVGSEPGEIADTREGLARLMSSLFSRKERLSWSWDDRTVTHQGEIAWVFAEGHVVVTAPERTDRLPYRLVCIFQRVAGDWRWRLFSGSQPA
jgi:hypothetical protein